YRDERRAFGHICRPEIAPVKNLRSQTCKVTRVDLIPIRDELAAILGLERTAVAAHSGRLTGQRCGGYAGDRSHPVQQIEVEPVEPHAVRPVLLIAAARSETDDPNPGGRE